MKFLFLFFIFAFSNILLDARRRLQTNPSVDDRVVQALSDEEHPEIAKDLIFEISLKTGSSARSRCRDQGIALCNKLGANDDSTSIYCILKEFNYIGPDIILDNSIYACFRYVYSVKTGEHDSIEKIASAAESDEVKVISEFNREIRLKSCRTQMDAPWGLGFMDRYQQSSTHSSTFRYNTFDGEGTVAYVIDTGIDSIHNEFEDRILGSENFVNPGVNGDFDGHGTHVAATIVGEIYGIAKLAKVYAINIFGSSDTTNSMLIIAAIQRAFQLAKANNEKAVINLSVGGPANSAEDNAANAAVANGVTVVVASGNDGRDACFDSPGRARDVITVSSSDHHGFWSSYSNHGSCVDIIAPGTSILSARSGTADGNKRLSGTSMAAPHVAGVVLQIMSRNDISDPALVRERLLGADALYSKRDVIFNVPSNTINLALQSPCTSHGPFNECAHREGVCRNGGTCIDLEEGFECECLPGLEGEFCEVQNECLESPCRNGATCVDLHDGYRCQCPQGFIGERCQTYNHPPEGCSCAFVIHPTWGAVEGYCKGWGGNQQPFCYVSGDCDEAQNSRAIHGAKWALCVSDDQYSPDTPSPTDSPTSSSLPSLSPTDPFPVDFCVDNECAASKICVSQDSGYDCICPVNRSGDDCEIEYIAPRGCTCVTMDHSSFGLIDSCTTRTKFPAWCYVEGNCAKTPSQHFEGYFWADCIEASPPTASPTFSMPTIDPTFSTPTSIPTASFPSIAPAYGTSTSLQSPSTTLAPPVNVGYVAPDECSCVSVVHPTFGQIDSCTTETDFPAWCYVEGECAKNPSSTFSGKYWADCVVAVFVGTPVPMTVTPTIMPTGFPTSAIPTLQPTAVQYLPPVRVLICQFFSQFWQHRCCWKENGSFSEVSLYSEGCPAHNQLRFIHVPEGVQAILYDGANFNGESHVLQTGNYNVRPDWASSLIVQST